MRWKWDTMATTIAIVFIAIIGVAGGYSIGYNKANKPDPAVENIPGVVGTPDFPGEGQESSSTENSSTENSSTSSDNEFALPPILPPTHLYFDLQTMSPYIIVNGERKYVVITDTRNLRMEFLEDLL